MAKCEKCGAELDESVRFCPTCGAQVIAEDETKSVEEAKAPVEEAKTAGEEVKAPVEEAKATVEEVKAHVEEAKATVEEAKATVEEVKPAAQHVYVPAPEKKTPEPKAETVPAAPAQQYYVPADNKIEDPMGLGRWIGLHILLAIPVVNIIVWLVLLCGGSKYQTKVNYIRGQLIAALIILAVVLAAVLIIAIFAPQILAAIGTFFSPYIPAPIA